MISLSLYNWPKFGHGYWCLGILDNTSGFDQTSDRTTPRHLKLVTIPRLWLFIFTSSLKPLGVTSKLNRRLTVQHRRLRAVNRRLSFEVIPQGCLSSSWFSLHYSPYQISWMFDELLIKDFSSCSLPARSSMSTANRRLDISQAALSAVVLKQSSTLPFARTLLMALLYSCWMVLTGAGLTLYRSSSWPTTLHATPSQNPSSSQWKHGISLLMLEILFTQNVAIDYLFCGTPPSPSGSEACLGVSNDAFSLVVLQSIQNDFKNYLLGWLGLKNILSTLLCRPREGMSKCIKINRVQIVDPFSIHSHLCQFRVNPL